MAFSVPESRGHDDHLNALVLLTCAVDVGAIGGEEVNLDVFPLREDVQDDGAGLEDPDVIAAEMVEDLRVVLDEPEANELDPAPEQEASML